MKSRYEARRTDAGKWQVVRILSQDGQERVDVRTDSELMNESWAKRLAKKLNVAQAVRSRKETLDKKQNAKESEPPEVFYPW